MQVLTDTNPCINQAIHVLLIHGFAVFFTYYHFGAVTISDDITSNVHSSKHNLVTLKWSSHLPWKGFQSVHRYTSGRSTFKFGLETTLSIQGSSKVYLVQCLSNQWKVLDTVTVKCLWFISHPPLESVTGAKITIATCTFLICNRLHKNVSYMQQYYRRI